MLPLRQIASSSRLQEKARCLHTCFTPDKLLLEIKNKPILQHSIDLMYSLAVYERILVTTETRLKKVSIPEEIKVLINQQPEKGKSESIRLGLNIATGTHFLFLPADQPGLTESDISQLLEAAADNPDKIVYPVINGQPGSPTIFPRKFRSELLALNGDTGGSVVRSENKDNCFGVEVKNVQNFTDIDTMGDFNDFVLRQ